MVVVDLLALRSGKGQRTKKRHTGDAQPLDHLAMTLLLRGVLHVLEANLGSRNQFRISGAGFGFRGSDRCSWA